MSNGVANVELVIRETAVNVMLWNELYSGVQSLVVQLRTGDNRLYDMKSTIFTLLL